MDFNLGTGALGQPVFGRVVEGMDVADAIGALPTHSENAQDGTTLHPRSPRAFLAGEERERLRPHAIQPDTGVPPRAPVPGRPPQPGQPPPSPAAGSQIHSPAAGIPVPGTRPPQAIPPVPPPQPPAVQAGQQQPQQQLPAEVRQKLEQLRQNDKRPGRKR